jgi:hypothetical protein
MTGREARERLEACISAVATAVQALGVARELARHDLADLQSDLDGQP